MAQSVTMHGVQAEPTNQDDCLFCHVHDESINQIMDESKNFYVRWDNFPANTGHVEVVPKRHIVSFFELTPDAVAEAFDLMKKVQATLDQKYQPQGYTIGINDGRAAGRTVDHLHIHLIPRYDGDVQDPRGGIRQIFPDCDPESWSSKH